MAITADNALVTTYSKFAISAGGGTTVSKAFEWQSLNYGKRATVMDTGGSRASRGHILQRLRDGAYTVGGSWMGDPGVSTLNAWLPLITGDSSGPYETQILGSALPAFSVFLDHLSGTQFTGAGNKVASATFSSSQGNFLSLAVAMEGKTWAAGSVTGLSALALEEDKPFIFEDASITIAGSAYEIRAFSLTLNNSLITDIFRNSLTRAAIPSGDLLVDLSLALPYNSDTEALRGAIGASGADVSLTLNNGTNSLNIRAKKFCCPEEPLDTPLKAEPGLPLQGRCYRNSTDPEVTFTIT